MIPTIARRGEERVHQLQDLLLFYGWQNSEGILALLSADMWIVQQKSQDSF